MDLAKRIERLKELDVLKGLSYAKLSELAPLLEPVMFEEGSVVLEEGTPGDCMYLVGDGRLRVDKTIPNMDGTLRFKELAVLSRGDFFGEMALLEDQGRSARVTAATACLLFTLNRKNFFDWLKNQPELTVSFFLTLLRGVSHRLRVTSREVALIYDLAGLFLKTGFEQEELISRALQDIVRHLESEWTLACYLHNPYNGDYELIAAEGAQAEVVLSVRMPTAQQALGWSGDRVLWSEIPGTKAPSGFLLMLALVPAETRDREMIERVAATVSRLMVSALLNLQHEEEETLKKRLKAAKI